MAYYDALIVRWATLTGTTDQKLAAVNALTVAGPNVDVQIQNVVGTLMLSGAYLRLAAFAQTAPTGVTVHDTALGASMLLMSLLTSPNAPPFNMSNATNYAAISGMLGALLTQETVTAGSTGITQGVHDALLALSATTISWWQAPVASNGGGLTSPITAPDLILAGSLT